MTARRLPGGLFGRLALLLVAAFLILHLVTLLTVRFFTDRQAARNEVADQAGSLALCLRLLDHVREQAARAELVHRLERLDTLNIRLTPGPEPETQSRDDLSLYLRSRLLDSLANLYGLPFQAGHLRTSVRRIPASRGADGAVNPEARGGMIYQSHVAVRLHDGVWYSLIQTSVAVGPSLHIALLTLSAGSLVMVSLALWLVHRLVRPLRTLAFAAERFGRDVDCREPLPEEGPEEVREAARAFNRMRERVRAAMAQHERMLASVAHDLRTPLTRLRLRVEQVRAAELRGKLLADLDALGAIMASSAELTGDVAVREAAVPTDMAAFLESMAADRQDMGQDVRFSGQCAEPFPIREKALRRCLENLLDNALRHAGGAEICLERQPDGLRIDVLDRGPGIPEAELQRVLEPFYRLDPARARHTGGCGLGLSIAGAMARLNNGDLALFNREGGGLCARLLLRA